MVITLLVEVERTTVAQKVLVSNQIGRSREVEMRVAEKAGALTNLG